MESDWKDGFLPHILARGEKYFEEGRVSRIQHCGDTYIATVAGTEDYTVTIDIENNKPRYMECDCPYAADSEHYCKHMAAVLFALECEDIAIEEMPPAKRPPIVSHIPMEMPWPEAIDQLPEEVVRKELLKQADWDEWLKERLVVLYLGKLSEGQLQNWKADLQKKAGEYTDRSGRIKCEKSWDFADDLNHFLNGKLPLLLEVRAVMDAFHLIWIVMETALEWEIHDYCDELEYVFEDCREAFEALLPMATDAQQKQMIQWYQAHRREDWPGGVEHMDRVFYALGPSNTPVARKRIVKYFDGIPFL